MPARRSAVVRVLALALTAGAVTVAVAPAAGAATVFKPGAVRNLAGTTTGTSVHVSWSSPSVTSTASAATGYNVVTAGCGLSTSVRSYGKLNSLTYSNLPHRCTATIIIQAKNSAGTSDLSRQITLTTDDAAPGKVQSLQAIVIDGAVRLKWAPPVDQGQSATLGYRVTANVGSTLLTTVTVGITGVDLPRMPAHVIVSFTVTPINKAGAGSIGVVSTIPGIQIKPVTKTSLSVKAATKFGIQVRVSTAFGDIPLGKDVIEVLARHGNGYIRVARIQTASNGIATFPAYLRSATQVVLRPQSHSIQGVLFRIGVHS